MKHILIFLLVLSFASKSKAQVVFCPPGAEWHYLFSGSIFSPGNTFNETVKYIGDSINGPDTLKILKHQWFYMTCGPIVSRTFIKQKGDTVFFYNRLTQGTWQILYNFAALPGQTWSTTTIKPGPATATFVFTVQSISSVTVNGYALRQMSVSTSSWGGTQITERFGSNAFLFNYSSWHPIKCDGDVFMEYLCYQDHSFGLHKFGEKSCDYFTQNSVGIEERQADRLLKVYPNPAGDFINIASENLPKGSEIRISNLAGQKLLNFDKYITASEVELDISSLQEGIYFLQVVGHGKLISTKKIIKE